MGRVVYIYNIPTSCHPPIYPPTSHPSRYSMANNSTFYGTGIPVSYATPEDVEDSSKKEEQEKIIKIYALSRVVHIFSIIDLVRARGLRPCARTLDQISCSAHANQSLIPLSLPTHPSSSSSGGPLATPTTPPMLGTFFLLGSLPALVK